MGPAEKGMEITLNVVIAFLLATVVIAILAFLVSEYTQGFVFFGKNTTEDALPVILGVSYLEYNS